MSFTESLDDLILENRTRLLGKHASWARLRLGDAVQVLNGFPFTSASFSKTNGKPLLRIRDVGCTSTDALFDGPFDDEFVVRAGDLVVGMDGDFRIAEWRGADALLNQRVCKLSANEEYLRKRFLLHVLPGYLSAIHGKTSSITVKHLSSRTVSDIPIPLPPLAEQDRVVAEIEKQFTRLDAGVAALKRVQAQLKRYRASVLKAACEGRLVPTEAELARHQKRDYEPADKLLARVLKERRTKWEADQLAKMKTAGSLLKDDRWKAKYVEPVPPDLSKLRPIPEGWVWTTVAAVGDILLGRRRAPEYIGSGPTRPYLRVANIKDDWVDLSDVESMDFDAEHFRRYELRPGDVLLCEGQSPDRVGQSAIYRSGPPGLCFQATLNRFRSVPNGPSPEFAQLVFRSHVKTGVFMRLASITTNIAHLTLEKLLASPFPLPPRAEQERIASDVAAMLSVAEAAEASIKLGLTRAARLRQGVLRRAFEGSLVAQNPKDEPASKLLERIRAAPIGLSDPKKPRKARTTRAVGVPKNKVTA